MHGVLGLRSRSCCLLTAIHPKSPGALSAGGLDAQAAGGCGVGVAAPQCGGVSTPEFKSWLTT